MTSLSDRLPRSDELLSALKERLPRSDEMLSALKERLPRSQELASALGLSGFVEERDVTMPVLGAFAMGVAVGAALGVLFAPRTGRETRAVVSERTGKLAGEVRDRLGANP